ncbi:Disease resistance protein RPM1 [Hordeum vulgare]|nr:Disease resistance protein RPM1 [Hordeum vulgare]
METALECVNHLLPKLHDLLAGEFTLQKDVKNHIEFLVGELTMMQAALEEVVAVPREHHDEYDRVWPQLVQDLSCAIEDIIDTFTECVEDPKNEAKKLLKKSTRLLKKSYDLDPISVGLKEVVCTAGDVNKMSDIFLTKRQDDIGARVDPCVMPLYTDVTELIGIEDSREKLISMLSFSDDWSKHPLKTVSIVGLGGSGKTALAKAAYDEIKGQFDCSTFVSVSQNPNMKEVFQNILYGLDKNKYAHIHNEVLEEKHLVGKLIIFLNGKRYLILIDDIWNESLWEIVKNLLSNNNNLGSRIITTTRIVSVSKACCSSANDSIYQMEPLSDDDSRKLLYARIFGSLSRHPPEFEQVSDVILKKCGGVPAAIIAMASILARDPEMKTKDQWHALLKSNSHGILEDGSMADMKRILWLSYYDLPRPLRICLLYLSTFPGTHPIEKHRLVKKLIAEGKVTRVRKLIGTLNKKEAKLSEELSLEEVAIQYLNELVNRNVIHSLECNNNGEVMTYHINPMMHDFLKAIAGKKQFSALVYDKNISRLLLTAYCVKFRHLSIDCSDSESLTDLSSMAFNCRVHSLTVFGHANRVLLRHFEDIRILDLEGCRSIGRADVEYICSMVLLKQLCLAKTDITQLPPQIGNLRYLEGLDVGETQITDIPPELCALQRLKTLDARKSRVKSLPNQVVWLTRLVQLLISDSESSEGVKLPDGIGKLTSLQQLGTIDLRKCSASSLKELGQIPYLKEITVVAGDEPEDTRLKNVLFSYLNKSIKQRSLVVYSDFRLSTPQSSSPYTYHNYWKKHTVQIFLKVPIVFAGQSFLGMLDIRVCRLEEDDLKILRDLPRLHSLIVRLQVLPKEMIHIRCEGFANLESFYVDCRMPRVTFEEGAMPILEHLQLKMYSGSASEEHMDIKNLLSLQKVTVRYSKWYASNKGVRETTEAVKTECKEHPNEITLCIAEEDKDERWCLHPED